MPPPVPQQQQQQINMPQPMISRNNSRLRLNALSSLQMMTPLANKAPVSNPSRSSSALGLTYMDVPDSRRLPQSQTPKPHTGYIQPTPIVRPKSLTDIRRYGISKSNNSSSTNLAMINNAVDNLKRPNSVLSLKDMVHDDNDHGTTRNGGGNNSDSDPENELREENDYMQELSRKKSRPSTPCLSRSASGTNLHNLSLLAASSSQMFSEELNQNLQGLQSQQQPMAFASQPQRSRSQTELPPIRSLQLQFPTD